MKLVQDVGGLQPQFLEVCRNAIDRRQFYEITTPGADVEFEIAHGLGFIPLGFLVASTDKAAIIYKGTTAWTTEKVFLKCNVATTAARILVF